VSIPTQTLNNQKPPENLAATDLDPSAAATTKTNLQDN
jgi:hypothetical protein